jgi:hypothetical protein
MSSSEGSDNPQSVKSVSPCYLSTLSVMSTTSNDSANVDVIDDNTQNTTILPPPMGPLLRQIGNHKWEYGKEKFRRLHNVYNALRISKYVIINVMLLCNALIIKKFTGVESTIYWVYNPLLIFMAILWMQKIMIFHKYPKITHSSFQKLSHYPGHKYDYGLLIAAKYPFNDRDVAYEYWIVHNKKSLVNHCITIRNYDYDTPYIREEYMM